MTTEKLITRETPNTSPDGKVWDVRANRLYPGLVEIYCVSNSQVKNPKELNSMFTGKEKAQNALNKWLSLQWTMAEEKQKKAPVRKETANAADSSGE